MKEKKTLLQQLLTRAKASALKVDRRAKKSFRVAAKNQGVSKKRIKAALKAHKPSPHPAKARAAAPEPETREKSAFSVKDAVRVVQKFSGAAGQLRTTGGRSLRRK